MARSRGPDTIPGAGGCLGPLFSCRCAADDSVPVMQEQCVGEFVR
jgi:hypothetical protein